MFHTSIFDDILDGMVKTCTLPEVRDYADVIVFLGCDPMNTHPRLLSRYAYYPRGEKRQHGWETDRIAITIDLRFSHTASICKEAYTIDPHRQIELPGYNLRSIAEQLRNRPGDDGRGGNGGGTNLQEADCILCLGFDLMNSLPAHGINGKMIVIDPSETLTSRYADVAIPCAAGGIDCAGSAVRMDGETVEIPLIRESERLSDGAILKRILEVV